MNSVAYADQARDWTRRLEDREAARSGLSVKEARPIVARRLGVAPGTLESVRKGRLKTIAAHIYDRLRLNVVAELQAEMRALEHELHVLQATGVDPRDSAIDEVVADLAKVRLALGIGRAAPSSDGEGG